MVAENCNYIIFCITCYNEYIITLKEVIDSIIFRGYVLEVVKMNNNKKVQDVLSIEINLGSADKKVKL